MTNVQLTADMLCIGGKPKILLCASLFYFRIPRENWEERMVQLCQTGYNCIDVYLPWNFHELRPGECGVEQQHIGAGLGDGNGRLDEPAPVARHQPHAVAGLDAAGP